MAEDKVESSLENRRFGGVSRLYGPELRERFLNATVVVAGLGGVGSWAAEALARTGIGHLVIIDFDHISESNTNRQLHAIEGQFGKAKVEAMKERILQINPEINLTACDEFLEPENLDRLIPANALILDATDSVQTKIALSVWAVKNNRALVMCGAAGGKSDPTSVRCEDLSRTEQDALLAKVRQGLRQDHGFSRNLKKKIGIRAIYSHEPRAGASSGGLACSGYGSTVMVTAACGLAAAAEILNLIAAQ
ncbi:MULTISPECIES: tRNA threonylcarbamoyladenosine dehydratase [unclassified Polynucleobacter]|jgi:tRNA A37 threonylcarbamoyladenosine dehydratase|uniref:tRNA threonylcarbamoyladenosine dehydratase n=1 Tax=unclassified Polynucleobacter TaxID=2640945 RepID=UPI000927E57E|nr:MULTISPECIES: tRNA threonylcarbamoyladenosine dehydratase [unclassified Polynucleobacter]MBU3563275.1 tRNA threonylcarbamoyladenosine dehydratase [Polynucleobacter sp. Tro8-14-1]MEA9568764.1 tRNA threonylcarbamoyladenosine dehydratase [Polynucleobacter sp. AP-Nickl1-40-C4]OJI04266.1 tRNA cyclic N6-threonylcarbamoyladenosine(37) synthase TcdA [Polynucleobacter sp. MWH-Adler-W8]